MEKKYDYSFSGRVSSAGTVGLDLYFPDKDTSLTKKESALADALAQSRGFMLRNGYLPPDARWMSPTDASKEYGFTRQYWEKLIAEGKVPYRETSAGRITTDLWVQGYLNNREAVDEYVKRRNKAVKLILELPRTHGTTTCANCSDERFDYSRSPTQMNGLCRAGCGFRIHTSI